MGKMMLATFTLLVLVAWASFAVSFGWELGTQAAVWIITGGVG